MRARKGTLAVYGRLLAHAGFHEVWFDPYMDGYLVYRRGENWGSFQYSDHEARYRHLMPIKPSIAHGSYMYMEFEGNPWTVQAAIKCASDSNWNQSVGWHANRRDRGRPSRAIPLHDERWFDEFNKSQGRDRADGMSEDYLEEFVKWATIKMKEEKKQ